MVFWNFSRWEEKVERIVMVSVPPQGGQKENLFARKDSGDGLEKTIGRGRIARRCLGLRCDGAGVDALARAAGR